MRSVKQVSGRLSVEAWGLLGLELVLMLGAVVIVMYAAAEGARIEESGSMESIQVWLVVLISLIGVVAGNRFIHSRPSGWMQRAWQELQDRESARVGRERLSAARVALERSGHARGNEGSRATLLKAICEYARDVGDRQLEAACDIELQGAMRQGREH